MRINGDGSIRIIYNGKESEFTTNSIMNSTGEETQISGIHAWNTTNYNDAKYVGYMYGGANGSTSTSRVTDKLLGGYNQSTNAVYNETSSNAKIQLELWYANNIATKDNSITDKIVDNLFCNDRQLRSEVGGGATGTGIGNSATTYYAAFYRLETKKTPSLKCGFQNDRFTVSDTTVGNGALEYPIGLLSADEASMAGLLFGTNNNTNYLYTNQIYWTFSPYFFYFGGASLWIANSDGYLSNLYVTDAVGLRPIISLDSGTTISGEGSVSNPYKVL